jgi:DNA-binding PadR family transcriptional regulator
MFNPCSFFNRQSPFQKGDLKYVLLDLIKDKPRHGYEIIRALEEQSRGIYAPSAGVIYPTLQMLEEMGFATSTQIDGKKVYSITAEGLQFLEKRETVAAGIKNQMKNSWGSTDMEEMMQFMADMRKISQLVGQEFRNAGPEKRKQLREVLARTYTELKQIAEK